MRVQPGDHRGKRRTTEAAGHVTVRVGEAFRSEPVDVRRLYMFVTHERIVRPCLVIRNNEDDIG